ncbi:glycoside hydrolase family 108 protein [Rhodanobacter glycinis]|uniref:glycoside hydrolase family 108 protein n=1 Tax=Rhodanobacter glycinis TaxID=582702 RepID=UPI001375D9FF|nr:glycoside hydrolase family 108 protein [Rhodanobacter glycinis]
MSAGNFAASLALTLVYEGLFSNNPKDPGGATMCGITQRVYDEDRDARRLPRQPVRLSTQAEREAIYHKRYWNLARCDDLSPGVDYAVFDFAVNSGVGRAVTTLQQVTGATADGAMGPATLASVQRYANQYGATALIDSLCTARDQFLRSLPTYITFGAGWTRRVMGSMPGHQMTDTGVIDRAWSMAMDQQVTLPAAPAITVKTYLAAASLAA